MRHLLPLLPIVLLAACDDYALEEQWAELERAEVRWERAGIDDYAFTMYYHCECLVSGEFAIVVHADSITSAKRVDDSGPLDDTVPAMTVPQMFERIRADLAREPDDVSLRFHERGYPLMADFDFDEAFVDEEQSFGIDQLTGLGGDS